MITLHFNDTTLQVQEDDSSYRYRAIMQKPQLFLKFSLPYYVEIPVGAWCEYQAEKYYLNAAPSIKKQSDRNIEYSLTMGTDEDKMSLYKLRNFVDKRLKFSMCAKPHEFIDEIVANLNERFGADVWVRGECIDSTPKTVEFNHIYIDAALQSVADTFETEWEVLHDTDTGVHTICLRKVEYFKNNPLPLSYGKGNGFIPGVGRTTASDEQPIKRLYVQGGEENIDRSKYGSAELLLPKGQKLEYEGRTYKSDTDGYYIERYDRESDAVKEDSLDCSEIYPKREGTVSAIDVVDEANNFYDFYDAEIPDSLNYKDCIIEGETPFIRFQTGMLAGEKDFEFIYHHRVYKEDGITVDKQPYFEIVPQEIDGQVMPNNTFKPAIGDKYAVFGIMLSDTYICDNTTKKGASWDMFREAVKFLYDHEDQKFTFTGTLQGLWAKRNWDNVGGYLRMGAYIRFTDSQFAPPPGTDIRIVGIKDFISNPHSPEIELSNNVSGGQFASALRDIQNTEVVIEDTRKSILSFTKRRFRDAQETQKMLEEALLNFSGSINPIAVQTMSMLVGDESLQFRCCDMDENGNLVQSNDFHITYNEEGFANQLHVPETYIQHMTLGINTISSSHEQNTYMVWKMGEYASATQDGLTPEAEKKYYLYAKVKKLQKKEDGTYDIPEEQGQFLLSETAIELNSDASYYHLLVGILNSEYEGTRSFVTLYGYTEILPGQVITDVIRSANGETYFDLVRGEIGGKIIFLSRDGSSYIDANDVYDEANKKVGGANLYAGEDIDVMISSSGAATKTTKAEIIELGTAVAGKSYIASYQSTNRNATCIVLSKTTPFISYVEYSNGVGGNFNVSGVDIIYPWGQAMKVTEDCKIFAVVGISAVDLSYRIGKVTAGYYHISKIMLQEGEKATGYIPYGASWEESYLAKALQDYAKSGDTTVDGGLLATTLILMKDPVTGNITAGFSGIPKDPVLIFGGGTYAQALAFANKVAGATKLPFLIQRDGTGNIGCFDVFNDTTKGSDNAAIGQSIKINTADGDIILNRFGIFVYDDANMRRISIISGDVTTKDIPVNSDFSYSNTVLSLNTVPDAINETAWETGNLSYAFNKTVLGYVGEAGKESILKISNFRIEPDVTFISSGNRYYKITTRVFYEIDGIIITDNSNMIAEGTYVYSYTQHKDINGNPVGEPIVILENNNINLQSYSKTLNGRVKLVVRISVDATDCTLAVSGNSIKLNGKINCAVTEPQTIIGRNGLVSSVDGNHYISIVSDGMGGQKISMKGLPSSGTDTGDLYVENGIVKCK